VASEGLAVNTCNTILAARGQPLLRSLAELLDAHESFLATVPQLDHFELRDAVPGASRYWGLLPAPAHGTTPAWPRGDQPKVLVYLKADYAPLQGVLKQLSEAPLRSLVYVSGLSEAVRKAVTSERLAISMQPLNMSHACQEADLILCQSGAGTVAAALTQGKPVLLLPTHVEQLLVTRRVEQLGAGICLLEPQVHRVVVALQQLLDDPRFRLAAQRFADQQQPGNEVAQAIAARCMNLALQHFQGQADASGEEKAPAASSPRSAEASAK